MWFFLTLITAVSITIQDVLNKKVVKDVNPFVVTWGWSFFSLPLLFVTSSFEGLPSFTSHYLWVVFNVSLLLIVALFFYVKALQESDVSVTVPILTTTPIFLLLTSWVMLREFPSVQGLAGILLIVIGSYALFFKERKKGFFAPFRALMVEKGPRYMLIVAFLFSISANMDKIGTNLSSPSVYLLSTNLVISTGLFLVILFKRIPFRQELKKGWKILLWVGFFNAFGLIFQMYAIKLTIVPYVISIKRMSVFFTSLVGFMLLKEKGFRERIVGCVLMLVGAILLTI